jgi:PAS domain S-box-containing protein
LELPDVFAYVNYLSRRAVFATATLLVLVVVTGTAAALLLYRNAALAGGEWHLRNIAVALAEQTRQGVLTVDLALRATAEEYGGEVVANRLSAELLQERMHRRAEELPQVRALFVINPDGTLIAHSDAFPAPQVDYGDRDYFAVQRDPVNRQVFFGTPVKGRVLQEWIYPLSRRISGAKDEFLGVATAAVDFPYFHEVYRSLELGPHARIFMFRRDGVLLTSFPQESERLGRSYAAHALFSSAMPAASSGVLRTAGLDDDHSRLIAYRSLPEYSLVLAVSSTTDYVLQEWRRQSLYAALGALAAIAFILSAAFLLARQLRVSQELTGKMVQSERRWLGAVEAAGHGVWDWDVASGKTVFSAQYHKMLGYSETEISADREGWLRLLHPEDRELAHQSSQACLEGRVDTFSTEVRLRSRDGSWKWVLNRGMAVSRDAQGRALRVLGTTTDVTAYQQAQELLRDSAARLNAIIGSAMDAIITVDRNQNIMLFNAAAERIFRCPARGAPGLEAIGAPLDRFIPERYRKTHRAYIEQFGATGVTMRRMGERIALAGVRADGEEFPIDASISQVEIGGEKFYTVILRDITQQLHAQQQLRDSEARLNAIIRSAMDAIITVDESQHILLFNSAAEKIFRCPVNEAVGGRLDRFIPERYRQVHHEYIERFGETGVTMRRMGENIVLAGLRADGEEFPIDASISQVVVERRKFYTVILRDITERQTAAAELERSHRKLGELYGVMHEVREAERIRIARELHDELAQWLTALKMDVSWMAARLPQDLTRLIDRTKKMKEVVDTTVAAVRRIAADLRPVMIDDLGLLPAIEHLLHEFSHRSGIMVSLDTHVDNTEFRDPLATAVYRMVQEALTNVARHAEATLAEVDLTTRGEDLVVRVRDNGRGVDDAALRKAKSYGVLGIRERAQTLGGVATIFRSAGGGTTVEITIPLGAHQRGQAIA